MREAVAQRRKTIQLGTSSPVNSDLGAAKAPASVLSLPASPRASHPSNSSYTSKR
jgi:hypothetical protein